MAVFLSVLRIIGIVLLCILGLILLMILCVLFVPFRYRVDAGKEESLRARARVHWLLYFVIVDLLYDDGINMRLRILGIPFYDKKKKEAKAARKREKEEARRKRKGEKDNDAAAENAAESGTEEAAGDGIKEEKAAENTAGQAAADKPEEKPAESTEAAEEESADEGGEKEKKPHIPLGKRIEAAWDAFTDFLWELPDKADEGIDGLLEKAEALKDKVSELWDTVDYYQRLLGSDGTAWVIEYVKKRILKILKGIRPRKIKAYLEIRDDDPGQVAKFWQYYAMALPVLDHIPGRVELDAQQDEKSFRFKAMVKGRVFVITLVKNGLALLLNRKVKRFIKLLKREDGQGKE
ncbi:MAG: hypothetical protein K5697_05155 [Lachnospiraceae bacterium]|nr:hypothetical protein [Lachnospiraceae bacterium]